MESQGRFNRERRASVSRAKSRARKSYKVSSGGIAGTIQPRTPGDYCDGAFRALLRTLVFVALMVILGFWAPTAHAVVLKTQYCLGQATTAGGGCHPATNPGAWKDSKSAACSYWHNLRISQNSGPPMSTAMGASDPQCQSCVYLYPNYSTNANCTGANGPVPYVIGTYAVRQVEEQCVAPLIEVNGQCVDKCSPNVGTAPNGLTCTGSRCSFFQQADPAGSPYKSCLPDSSGTQGCEVSGTLDLATGAPGGGWYMYTTGNTFTGSSCTPGTVETPTDTPDIDNDPPVPPPGKCPGTVNGVTVYVDCDRNMTPSTPNTSTVTQSNPDGTTQTTTQTGSGTTCTNGVCTTITNTTTTVTVTPSSGTGTSTTSTERKTETQTISEYCEDHPEATVCKDESAFGGSCGAGGFTCSGDAVQCAAAKAVNEAKCLMTASSGVQAVVDSMSNGTYAPDPATVTKSIGEFLQTNPFSGGCPSNQTLTLAGASVTIPLASVCSELNMMGNVLVAFTLLGATVFVLKGLGGS